MGPMETAKQAHYRTKDVCALAGISRSTLLRWIEAGVIDDARYRDRKGWRIFTEEELHGIVEEANQLTIMK